ncbi:MAG: hypothetical protein IPF93_25370 [Saprospiraceae bacterium]|nr:hypothetical protein [Saprospiraceae bacterium]
MTSDGQNQIFEVEIWVTDKAGKDLCKTYIKLQGQCRCSQWTTRRCM